MALGEPVGHTIKEMGADAFKVYNFAASQHVDEDGIDADPLKRNRPLLKLPDVDYQIECSEKDVTPTGSD